MLHSLLQGPSLGATKTSRVPIGFSERDFQLRFSSQLSAVIELKILCSWYIYLFARFLLQWFVVVGGIEIDIVR